MIYGNIWKRGNLDTHEEIQDVTFTGTRWVAVASFGRVCRSTDGKNWSKQSVPGLDVKKDVLFGIAYDRVNDILVAVGRDELIISSEGDQGATWTVRKSKIPGTLDFYKVAFGNNMFLAVTEQGNIWKSTDGTNWAKSASLGVGSRHIAFGNGWFMVATVPGKIFRSQDGITWKGAHLGGNIKSVHYDGNSLWLAAGNKIRTSNNNGANWTKRLKLSDFGIYCHLYCVTSAPGTYIAAGEDGLVLTSDDGIEWRKHQQFTRRYIFGMAFGKSLLAAVGTGKPRNPQKFFKYSTHYSPEGGTPPYPPDLLVPRSDNTIEIKSPRGGEKLKGGSRVKIKWTGSITYDKIDIKYYKGSKYVVIKKGIKDTGVYTWTVPNVSTSKARIMIEGRHPSGNAVDYSDNMFTIIPVPVVKITITAPKGREILTGGTTYNIKWQSSITFDKVDIEYYNGSKWVVIKNGTKDDGSYSWSVPNISTTKAKIWIKGWSCSGNPVDRSDDMFTISPPASITVTSPNGGEVLIKGSTENITWTSSGEVGKVNVSYSTDSGLNWTTIASSTPNNGTLAWKVPGAEHTEDEDSDGQPPFLPITGIASCDPDAGPIKIKTGYSDNINPREIYPGNDGIRTIEIRELQRIMIHLSGNAVGCMMVNGKQRRLPIGSKMDSETGIFYWQPGPGFIDEYHFVFIEIGEQGVMSRKDVVVKIAPKFASNNEKV